MAVDKNWVIDSAKALERFYRQRNENILAWRALYFMDPKQVFQDASGNFVEAEDDEIRIILPLAHTTVDSFKAILLSRPPVIDVPASEILDLHYTQIDQIERTLYAVWDRANVVQAIQDALWHALVDGWGVLQVRFDPQAEEMGRVPIFVKSVDPIGVYPMPSERPGEWEYVIASYYELAGTLRKMFVSGKDKRKKATRVATQALEGLDEDSRIQVLEYWDDKYHGILIVPTDSKAPNTTVSEGEWVLLPTEHGYGTLPFFIFHGLTFPFKDRGERIGVSVLWPIEEMIKYLCKLISQKATIIARYANPTLVTYTQSGESNDISLFGDKLNLYTDERAEFLMPPGPMPEISVQMEEVLAQLEMAGLPRHMMGQLTVSRLSGVAMNLLRTPVLMRIASKQMAIEKALERMNESILKIIENRIEEPVYLWGNDQNGRPIEVFLNPEIVNGYYRNRVRLSASLPTDEPATVAMLSSLRQLEIISKRTMRDIVQQTLRDLSPQSLEMEEDQIQIENLLSMPEIQQGLMYEAASEAGILDRIKAAQELLAQQKGGPNAQGSQPGFPGLGSETGLSPFNPLNQLQGSAQNPRSADVLRGLIGQVSDFQGGRPGSPVESPLGPDVPTEVG